MESQNVSSNRLEFDAGLETIFLRLNFCSDVVVESKNVNCWLLDGVGRIGVDSSILSIDHEHHILKQEQKNSAVQATRLYEQQHTR